MRDTFKLTLSPRPDDSDGGGYICNQCTPKGGSGFDLLTLVFGYSFTESVNQVSALPGLSDGLKEWATYSVTKAD
ncbi:hypothetical protein [Neisseria maigaei]|uniref:hypothetical protein n=1 Tax=Neisseria maigaei TaxID=2830651 RepID=UPI002659C33E|nr:hypothetical protein [Neisseria maigaei]